jgi:hypothetical protein
MRARLSVILLSILAMLAPAAGSAAVFSVGTAPGCTHPTLAGALAAAVANGPGEDFILLSAPISGVAIDTSGTDLVIAGGYTNCAGSPTPSSRTVLTGNGIAPVIQTSGRNLRLRNLTLTGGGTTNLVGPGNIVVGGGVSVTNGILDIDDSTIENNRASIGGGVAVVGANAVAVLGGGTEILFNEAGVGGGMYFAGNVLRISYTRPGAFIGFNRAVTLRGTAGKGGGLYVDRVTGTGGSTVLVGPVSWEVGQPFPQTVGFRLVDNESSGNGAGLYVFGSSVDAAETVIAGNRAPSGVGGGVYLDAATLRMYRLDPAAFGPPTPKCPAHTCARLRDNLSLEGGALFVSSGSRAEIAQALITENRAATGAVVRTDDAPNLANLTLRIDSSVVALNRCTAGFTNACGILDLGAGRAELRFVTFADNTFEPIPTPINLIKGPGSLVVKSSILRPAAGTALYAASNPAPTVTADCNAAPSPGFGSRPLATMPTFPAAPASYRPDETSAAIDHCDGPGPAESGYLDPNLDSRGTDNPDRPNGFGVFDIGAYETQPLLRNGFD